MMYDRGYDIMIPGTQPPVGGQCSQWSGSCYLSYILKKCYILPVLWQ